MATHSLVVDVGGTKILAAAIAPDGAIVARHKLRTDRKSKENLLAQLDAALEAVLQEAKITKNQVGGLCLAVPGVVNSQSGHVVLTPNAPLTDTPLGAIFRQKWSCPVIVGNDVNLGTAGEFWCGAAKNASSAFGIFVGTGIGGGLFLNGQLIEGFRGLGGEIGHLLIPTGADQTAGPTKKHLFLEDLCSRTALETQLRHAILVEKRKSVLTEIVGDKKFERIRSGALKEALKRNDPLVTQVMQRASHLLGLATASVLHVVDPEIIVFGGGVIEACGKWMLPWIEKTAQKVAMPGTGQPLKIVQSSLGDDAILLGGWSLLRHQSEGEKSLQLPLEEALPEMTAVKTVVDKPLDG